MYIYSYIYTHTNIFFGCALFFTTFYALQSTYIHPHNQPLLTDTHTYVHAYTDSNQQLSTRCSIQMHFDRSFHTIFAFAMYSLCICECTQLVNYTYGFLNTIFVDFLLLFACIYVCICIFECVSLPPLVVNTAPLFHSHSIAELLTTLCRLLSAPLALRHVPIVPQQIYSTFDFCFVFVFCFHVQLSVEAFVTCTCACVCVALNSLWLRVTRPKNRVGHFESCFDMLTYQQ